MAKLSDYPYDPKHAGKPEHFVGIHKVRAFEDDKMRRVLFEILCDVHGVELEVEATGDES